MAPGKAAVSCVFHTKFIFNTQINYAVTAVFQPINDDDNDKSDNCLAVVMNFKTEFGENILSYVA